MAYDDYYNGCNESLDPHYSQTCSTDYEKGRIRRGGWLKNSAYATVMADPTNAAVWNAAKAAGDFILLPELSGTFDGGSPVFQPGYGDSKEQFVGSDFVANIKDPEYKLNWAHYRSLQGKTSWHFVYLTETQLHVSSVPVTVAPKNPITENLEDNVVWDSEVRWFERFTPAPHDAPMSAFTI